jgi:predicted RNA-binding protein associated with RNAse of E/G family
VAWWWDDPDGRWVGVDVCTPPRLARGTWTYEDLELDPVGNEAGFVRLVDEDEFEEARAKGWISSDEVDAALQATTEIETMMRTRVEPFGTLAWQRLQEAVDLSLPPLVAAPGRVLADPGAQH